MEFVRTNNEAVLRRFGVGILLASGAMLPAVMAGTSPATAEASPGRVSPSDIEWTIVEHEDFNGPAEGWEVIGADPSRGLRYGQYRPENVEFSDGAANITSYRHCGIDPTVQNRQTQPCPPGVETTYTSGRIEQTDHTIEGDFKIFVKAKMTVDKKDQLVGTRYELWGNNLTKYPDIRNLGYCIEGETPLGEFDMAEIFSTKFATANNINHCEDGELHDAPRKLKMPKGWLKKTVRLTATRVDGKMEFTINGEAIPLRDDTDRTQDRLRDFSGVTWSEYDAAQQLPFGLIYSTAVNTFADTKNWKPVDDTKPYRPHTLSVLDVRMYKPVI